MNRARVRLRRRPFVAALVACASLVLAPAVALAHPLGNFTINHFAGIRVSADRIALDIVIDKAEIPTFSERQRIDTDGDGQVSDAETEAERKVACGRLAPDLALTVGGSPVALAVVAAGISFPPGAGGLDTMRIVCEYDAIPASPLAAGATIHFRDGSDEGRLGWREIVVTGDGLTLDAPTPSTSVSGRLTHYPQDLLAVPLATTEVTIGVTGSGPATAPPCIPDASPLASAPTATAVGFGCDTTISAAPPAAGATPVAAVPGGVGSDIAGLLSTKDLTPIVLVASFLTAMLLGAAHAVTPGHGKTVMAAYLVGTRGTARHAVALGLTVTISHTLGVLVLAFIVLSVSRVTPESFNHVAGIVSGLLVMAIGTWLFTKQGLPLLRRIRASATPRGGLAYAHAHVDVVRTSAASAEHDPHGPHGPHDDRDRDLGGRHAHAHEHDDGAGVASTRPPGWHEHGGVGHSHMPADDTPLTWRSLFALGLFGGLVPSVNALIILLATMATGRAAYGIVLVVAFGIGMALVLAGVGLGLVFASRFMARNPGLPGFHRLIAWAPGVTSLVIVVVGAWLTGQAIWGTPVL